MFDPERNRAIVSHSEKYQKTDKANSTGDMYPESEGALKWFGPAFNPSAAIEFGLKLSGGGVHQSKTMMSDDIDKVIMAIQSPKISPKTLVVHDNILSKPTLSTRVLTYGKLNTLYGLEAQPPISQVMKALRYIVPESRELLYLLTALSRDPLLRDSAEALMFAPIGERLFWSSITDIFQTKYPERFTLKMVNSLSRNCASSWTQSGHLQGRVKKIRRRISPRPCAVAFGALIANVCGFGGSTLLESPWLRIMDISPGQALDLLRQAEAQGLARVRSVGDVLEISIRQQMARTIGVPELA